MLSMNQPQAVTRGDLPASLAGDAVAAPAPETQHLSSGSGLEFSVRYSLAEYTRFMWQHGGYLIRRRRVGGLAGLWLRLRSTFSAALNFVMLGRGRKTYEFTIDAHGIVRTCGGVNLIDWSDVCALRSYSHGFMLVLKRGTLPIPYRCLSTRQRKQLRALAGARRLERA